MKLILRPYQDGSIEGLRDGFRAGHKHQVLAAATGAGKSIIALSMLEAAVAKGTKSMFVCDRRVLVDQFSRHLDAHGLDHGVYMAKHWRYRPHAKLQVASIQTLEKMQAWPSVDLMVVDEVHAVMRKSLCTYLKNNRYTKVIGLTATPFNPALGEHFTSVTNVVTMRQLVDEGYLVPFRVFSATEVDVDGVKVVAGEWQKDELESRSLQIVGDVVADYVRLSTEVFGGPRKTICFSAGVAHGKELVDQFARVGLNFVQISYLDDEEYKAEVLREFAKPDTNINGVISSDILTRGFDQTDVEHVILAKPLRKSFSQHVQMVGRGSRSHDGKGFCVIQDNAGNWLRFAEDWADLYENGTKDLKSDADSKQRKEPTEEKKKESKCPKCGHLWGNADMCAHCGHVRERRSMVSAVPGMLKEIDSAASAQQRALKQRWYSELIWICRDRGYKPGWAAAKFKDKFGDWPRNLRDEVATPSVEVIRWETAQRIRWAKSARRGAA